MVLVDRLNMFLGGVPFMTTSRNGDDIKYSRTRIIEGVMIAVITAAIVTGGVSYIIIHDNKKDIEIINLRQSQSEKSLTYKLEKQEGRLTKQIDKVEGQVNEIKAILINRK